MTLSFTPRTRRGANPHQQMDLLVSVKCRRGTLTVCVLVCLLVAASLAGATTQAALRWRRSMRLEHQLRQTELLLDAGILRAAKQIQRSTDYQGEIWQPNQASVGFESPVIQIRILPSDTPQTLQVEVVAELGSPLRDLQRSNVSHTRRSHRFSVSVDGELPKTDTRNPESPDSGSQNNDSSSPE